LITVVVLDRALDTVTKLTTVLGRSDVSRKGTQVINSSTMAVLAILVAATLSGSALNLMDLHKITLEEDITKIVSNRVASGSIWPGFVL